MFKQNRARLVLAFVVMCVFSTARLSRAGEQMQTYDVRDLMISIPDYSTFNKASPALSKDQVAANLVAVVQNALPPDAVSLSDTTLTVKADAQAQAEVAALLHTIRVSRGSQIQLAARVISLSPAAFAKLDRKLRTRLLTPQQPTDEPASLTPEEVSSIVAAGQLVIAPHMTCFDRQTASISVATPTPYVSDLRKVAAPDGHVGYVPEVSEFSGGLTLQSVATLVSKSAMIAVKLQCEYSTLLALKTVDKFGGKIQQLDAITYRWNGLYVVPRNITLALPCFDATRTLPTSDIHPGDRIFLLVDTSVLPDEHNHAKQ